MKITRSVILAAALFAALPAFSSLVHDSTADAATICPTKNFPKLTGSAGTGYAKPSFSVKCTSTTMTVTSNGMISYKFVQKTPNKLAAQKWSWSVPLKPIRAASTTTVDSWMGTTGFTVSGLPIYGPMEGAQPTSEAFGDPVYNGLLDSCKGHTGPSSEYHYHALVGTKDCGLGASPLLGYALDGFPIYGPRGCLDLKCTQVVTFESGYQKTGDPKTNAFKAYTYQQSAASNVLDECNGRVGPDGQYQYHATSTWPYTFSCFRGTPTRQSGAAAGPMPPMASSSSSPTSIPQAPASPSSPAPGPVAPVSDFPAGACPPPLPPFAQVADQSAHHHLTSGPDAAKNLPVPAREAVASSRMPVPAARGAGVSGMPACPPPPPAGMPATAASPAGR